MSAKTWLNIEMVLWLSGAAQQILDMITLKLYVFTDFKFFFSR